MAKLKSKKERNIITTFPYHAQEKTYTCGAAAMRMALEHCGIKKTEKQIAQWLKTNTVRGTWPKQFMTVAERFKLNHVTMRNATWQDLRKYQADQYVIIVCYYYAPEKIDHYAVLRKINADDIFFWDPYFGPEHKYRLTHFQKIWKSAPRYDNEKSWFFALQKP